MNFVTCIFLTVVGTYFFAEKLFINSGWRKIEAIFGWMFIETVLNWYCAVELSELTWLDILYTAGVVSYFFLKIIQKVNSNMNAEKIKEKLEIKNVREEILTGDVEWIFYILVLGMWALSAVNRGLIILVIIFVMVLVIRTVYRGKKLRELRYIELVGNEIYTEKNKEKMSYQIKDIGILTVISVIVVGGTLAGVLNESGVVNMILLLTIILIIFFVVFISQ